MFDPIEVVDALQKLAGLADKQAAEAVLEDRDLVAFYEGKVEAFQQASAIVALLAGSVEEV